MQVKPTICALSGTLALLAPLLVPGTAVADPVADGADWQPTAITWQPCPEDATAQCGTLRLPIDWNRPRGETFDLAVARRTATDPARRTGVLLLNPGGPGGSGVDSALGARTSFSPAVQASFDIIGFDPRGVARSQPVRCSVELLNRAPSQYPASQAEFDRLVAYNRELREDCRRHSGPIFDHADTLNVVRDMDALRRALGEKQINYFGVSYGTLIGQQYAERHGDKIRAMVIDSNMDHSLGTRGFLLTEARTAEASFTEWVKWCDRTPSCALHGRDVAAVWDAVLAKADRGELTLPGDPTVKITTTQLTRAALGAFYGPAWAELADLVAELDAQVPATTAVADQETAPNPFEAVFCQDWHLPVRDYQEYSRLYAAELRAAPHMRGSPVGHSAVTSCLGSPERVNNPQDRLDIREAPQILMLNALYDPATGYEWAVNAHRQAKRSTVLVTYEGWGHGVYRRSDCTRGAVDNYLVGLTVPPDGMRCAAVEPPAQGVAPADATTGLPAGPKPGIPGWLR